MGGSGLLRERDLRALTAVVEDGLRDEPGEAMPWAVLDQLLKVVPCEHVNFNEYDLREHRPVTLPSVDEGGLLEADGRQHGMYIPLPSMQAGCGACFSFASLSPTSATATCSS
jgi:hypothetical protein